MTDNEIIEAFEQYIFQYIPLITGVTVKDVLDLINRQKAEIERLQNHIKNTFEHLTKQCIEYEVKTAKTEAIKEFEEKLNQLVEETMPKLEIPYWKLKISTIAKEMTENNDKEYPNESIKFV